MIEHVLTIEMSYTHGGKTASRRVQRVCHDTVEDGITEAAAAVARNMMSDFELDRIAKLEEAPRRGKPKHVEAEGEDDEDRTLDTECLL